MKTLIHEVEEYLSNDFEIFQTTVACDLLLASLRGELSDLELKAEMAKLEAGEYRYQAQPPPDEEIPF